MSYTNVRGHVRNLSNSKPFAKMPKGYAHLPIEIAIMVPSTYRDEKIPRAEFVRRINETRKKLSELFGGYTSIEAKGGWVTDRGELIKENVVRVVAFADLKRYKEKQNELLKWLEKKKKEWKQEALAYEFEGDLYLI